MRKSGEALRSFGETVPQVFAGRVAAFLRMIHPLKTAACVEADTSGRIPAKTVSKWLEGAASPNGQNYNELLALPYGAELFVYVNPDASSSEMREVARLQHQARLERENAELRARLSGQLTEIWGGR